MVHVGLHCPDFMKSVAEVLLLVKNMVFEPRPPLPVFNFLLAGLGRPEGDHLRLSEHV